MELLSYLGKSILLYNIVLYAILTKRGRNNSSLFLVYLCFVFLLESIIHIFSIIVIHNIFLTHIYIVGQSIILNIFYCRLIDDGRVKKKYLYFSALLYCLLTINILSGTYHFHVFNYSEILLCNLMIISGALAYMYDKLGTYKYYGIFSISLLLYTVSTTIIFLSGNVLISFESVFTARSIWHINIIMFLLFQLATLYNAVTIFKKKRLWKER